MAMRYRPNFRPRLSYRSMRMLPNRRPSLMSITTTELMTWTINPAPTKTSIAYRRAALDDSPAHALPMW